MAGFPGPCRGSLFLFWLLDFSDVFTTYSFNSYLFVPQTQKCISPVRLPSCTYKWILGIAAWWAQRLLRFAMSKMETALSSAHPPCSSKTQGPSSPGFLRWKSWDSSHYISKWVIRSMSPTPHSLFYLILFLFHHWNCLISGIHWIPRMALLASQLVTVTPLSPRELPPSDAAGDGAALRPDGQAGREKNAAFYAL